MSAHIAAHANNVPALRLGFLGLGWIGRRRLDAIAALPQVRVAALADNDPQRLEAVRLHYGLAQAATSLDELLACGLDGVVIATPNGLHAEQAVACLSRGVAVFCQKPLATNAADSARVLDAAQRADRLLGVDFCYRHLQGMGELRRRLMAGQLGRVAALDLQFHNAYGPDKSWCFDRKLAGGGCLLDLGSHLIDLAQWLLGEAPMRLVSCHLFAQGRPVAGSEIEDLAFAEFRHDEGALIRLACSWHCHAGQDAVIQMRLMGTRGGAVWRNVDGSFYDFEIEVTRGAGRELLGGFPDPWADRALRAWVEQLARNPSFDPQAQSFLNSAELIDAVYAR